MSFAFDRIAALRDFLAAIVLMSIATGCHADMTYRLEFHRDKMVTITAREIIDDQLYELALNQNTSGDPFGVNAATRAGWTVERSTDENENHVVTMTRDVSIDDFAKLGTEALPNAQGKVVGFDPAAFQRVSGVFKDTDILQTTIPAIFPANGAEDSSNPWYKFGQTMATSVIGIHLEIKTPGKVIATNGEATPDGYTRWDLALQNPTVIRYRVETPNVTHITIAIVCGVALVALVAALVIRARRSAPIV